MNHRKILYPILLVTAFTQGPAIKALSIHTAIITFNKDLATKVSSYWHSSSMVKKAGFITLATLVGGYCLYRSIKTFWTSYSHRQRTIAPGDTIYLHNLPSKTGTQEIYCTRKTSRKEFLALLIANQAITKNPDNRTYSINKRATITYSAQNQNAAAFATYLVQHSSSTIEQVATQGHEAAFITMQNRHTA